MQETMSYAAEQLAAAENKEMVQKPPIGAAPYHIVAVERINELLKAIGRYINYQKPTRDTTALVKLWVTELGAQVDLLDTLLIYE